MHFLLASDKGSPQFNTTSSGTGTLNYIHLATNGLLLSYTTIRCSWCVGGCGEQEVDRVEENRGAVFLKSAEVASIAGINADDVVLGKTSNDVSCKYFSKIIYV